MDKEKTLEAIQKARAAHESQMAKIEALIDGKEVDNPTAVAKTKCEFGKWLYDEDNKVQKVLGAQFYQTIETVHEQWHIEYMRIFEIFFKDKKKGFFSKIVGSDKVNDMEIDKAKLYYSELLKTTDDLLKILASSERRITALSDSKFR